MEFIRGLRHLWRHPLFRKLVAVRLATQASDGILQVGMAAYVFFSPQKQPDAWSIALVLAVTLLPFSIVGPFVSLTLDRFSRRQVAVLTDAVRVAICVMLAWLVLDPEMGRTWKTFLFYGGVLVAMSLNRYLLAGLSASLPHTVDEDEYLIASSVMPTIGPAGVLVGAGVATGIRFAAAPFMETYQADAIVFGVAATGFALTVMLALRIGRWQLGPDLKSEEARRTRVGEVVEGLTHAVAHLRERRPAGIGLTIIALQRVVVGMTQVATMLLFRNWFHPVDDVAAAMKDLALWAGATGAGYIASAALVPPLVGRFGVRRTMIGVLVAAGVFQIVPGSIFSLWTLVLAGFLLGVASQTLKICVDTLVQAHVDDDFKGRVFTIYDMIFNACFVLAAVIVALTFPLDGHSMVGFVAMGVAFLAVAAYFMWRSGRIGSAIFNRGTRREAASEGAATTA
ncbi:MFS transporter [Mariniluteicoccus flavus]